MESKKGPYGTSCRGIPKNRTHIKDCGSLVNERVNEISELYGSPERREYCWKSARELHEQTWDFHQKAVEDPKFDLSVCPWPFGLIIVKECKGENSDKITRIQLHGFDRTTRGWKVPEDIAAVHTFLALFRDEHLGGDRIITYEIRDICPCIGISPLIMSDTAEVVQIEIPALIRCARADLIDKGFFECKRKKRKKAGKGRPKIKSDEAERRRGIVEEWEGAKKAKISRHDFTEDKGITIKDLKICMDWMRTGKRAK